MRIKRIKGFVGIFGVVAILYMLPRVALGLASDRWIVAGRDEQINREWERARMVCVSLAVVGIPMSVWAFRKGHYS